MRRGDIAWVDFGQPLGSEAGARRPAVIVSNDAANEATELAGRGVISAVPTTGRVERRYPFRVLLPAAETVLPAVSLAQAEHVRAVAFARISRPIGRVPVGLMADLESALRMHLDL